MRGAWCPSGRRPAARAASITGAIIIIIYKENARARGYDLLGPAYLGGQGFGYGGRCKEKVV